MADGSREREPLVGRSRRPIALPDEGAACAAPSSFGPRDRRELSYGGCREAGNPGPREAERREDVVVARRHDDLGDFFFARRPAGRHSPPSRRCRPADRDGMKTGRPQGTARGE